MIPKVAAISNLAFWLYVALSFFQIDLSTGHAVERDYLVSYIFALILLALVIDLIFLAQLPRRILRKQQLGGIDYFNILSAIALLVVACKMGLFNADLV